jgi:hypothetical protein
LKDCGWENKNREVSLITPGHKGTEGDLPLTLTSGLIAVIPKLKEKFEMGDIV